jgi:predicted component of type VI protein secretion system
MPCFPLREVALESNPMTQQILNWKHCVVGACSSQNAANEKTAKSRSLSLALISSNSYNPEWRRSITQG